MAFPKNQSAERAKRPIALDVFRYLVCRLSPEGSEANLPLRTTMPMGFAVFQNGGIVSSTVLRTFRSASSLPHLRCGPRPLTAAGGQGPQDNTAYDLHIHSCTLKPAPKLLPTRFTAILPFCFIPWGAHAAHRLRTGEPFVTVAQPLRRSTYMENRGHGKDLCTSAWNPPSPLAVRSTCKTEDRPNGPGEPSAAYQPALRWGKKPQRGAVIHSGAPSA